MTHPITGSGVEIQIDAAIAVPMHFGMWEPDAYGAGATVDPTAFVAAYSALRPGRDVAIPRLGPEPFAVIESAAR